MIFSFRVGLAFWAGISASIAAATPGGVPSPVPSPAASPGLSEWLAEDLVRDFPLRSLGTLHVTNLRGGVQVQGWALDKIRVRAKRKVLAMSEEEAQPHFDSIDFRYRKVAEEIELSAEYGRGLDISEKLKERADPRASMDIIVQAPAGLNLRVWSIDGAVSVSSWRAKAEVRTQSGSVSVRDIRSSETSVFCPSCRIQVRDVSGDVRVMGGTGAVDLEDIRGSQLFVETSSGEQKLERVRGNLVLLSKSGAIHGRSLSGRFEFQTDAGPIEIMNADGFASGRTETGNIKIEMRRWKYEDKALFESQRGTVSIQMPPDFAGEVDLRSVFGKAFSAFPIESSASLEVQGPSPANHLMGRVASGTEQFKVLSHYGDVHLARKM